MYKWLALAFVVACFAGVAVIICIAVRIYLGY